MDFKKTNIQHLVVDTGAFLKNASLQDIATNIYTVQDVIDEVTSKPHRQRLTVLPYDVKIREPLTESIRHVNEFSKKTGDYPNLSSTDIRVLALTYELEKEFVGTEHLPAEPTVNHTVSFGKTLPGKPNGVPGFYLPKRKNKENADASALENELQDLHLNEQDKTKDNTENNPAEESAADEGVEEDCEDDSEYESCNSGDESGNDDDEDCDDDDDDDDGWITPDNISQMKQEFNGFDVEEDKNAEVACITEDFAMQNTLKQMGLKIVSVNGRVIRNIKTFILRCYACYVTTGVMTKIFCPRCGYRTLKRVAVSINEDGTQQIHLSSRYRITGKGKKFSLPMPKGGNHANNPILSEDQRIPQQRPSRLARQKTNALNPDYIAGSSPFVMRDVTSRAAQLGIYREQTGWNRRHPNEPVKRKGKRK